MGLVFNIQSSINYVPLTDRTDPKVKKKEIYYLNVLANELPALTLLQDCPRKVIPNFRDKNTFQLGVLTCRSGCKSHVFGFANYFGVNCYHHHATKVDKALTLHTWWQCRDNIAQTF